MSTLDDRTTELLARPSLEGLSFALRNLKSVLPKWCWRFGSWNSCAVGVAHALWPGAIRRCRGKDAEAAFGLTYNEAGRIFCARHVPPLRAIFRGVAPSEVAAGIDMLLAERAARAGQTPEEGQN
jgi:hypothetical protein